MNTVSLIFTVHEDHGSANERELHTILLRIQPNVLFLEVPAAAFDDYYVRRARSNLESHAVIRFAESYSTARLLAIDLPTPPREFFEDTDYLCNAVRAASPKYRQLARLDADRTATYGFAYLNSEYCSAHWSDVYAEIAEVTAHLGDPRLSEILKAWKRMNELRELEMIKNIRHYCATNSFSRGALLLGAAHRQSFMEKCAKQSDFKWSELRGGGDA